jgi:hypothetical protein
MNSLFMPEFVNENVKKLIGKIENGFEYCAWRTLLRSAITVATRANPPMGLSSLRMLGV